MGLIGNIIEALRNLAATPMRSILALIGIVIGTGSVIAMVNIGEIVSNESLRRFKELGVDQVTIYIRGERERGGVGIADLSGLETAWADVEGIFPIVETSIRMKTGKDTEYVRLLGVTEDFSDLMKLRLASGRFVSFMDEYRQFCVVGATIAEAYARAGQPVAPGSVLRLDKTLCTVVGILDPSPQGVSGLDPNRSLILPISTMTRIAPSPFLSRLVVRVVPGADHDRLSSGIKTWFSAQYHGLSVDVTSPKQIVASMNEQKRLFTLLLGVIGSISLIVGGVGVMNIMLVSVSERRKEIGIRKALGARRRDIQNLFLAEAFILSAMGGLLGIGLGLGVVMATSHFNHWEFILSTGAVVLGFGVSVAVGIFFGFYPAAQASRMDTIEALRE